REGLARIVADGAGLGIFVVATADRASAVPAAVANLVPEKLLFRLGDRYDYSAFGVAFRSLPAMVPGRCLDVSSGLEVQIALPGRGPLSDVVASAVGRHAAAVVGPQPVGALPETVSRRDIAAAAAVLGD